MKKTYISPASEACPIAGDTSIMGVVGSLNIINGDGDTGGAIHDEESGQGPDAKEALDYLEDGLDDQVSDTIGGFINNWPKYDPWQD